MRRVFHILMVEDDPAAVQLFKHACHDRCIRRRLHHVPDGPEALAFLEQHIPDIIVLDLNLPKMSGLDVLRRIKSDARTRRIPVIVLSASESPTDINTAYDFGAACFINKPVDLDDTIRALDSSLHFWFVIASTPPKIATAAR